MFNEPPNKEVGMYQLTIYQMEEEMENLKKQLAEKDKEIERLNNLLADTDDELEEIEKVYAGKCKWLDKRYQELIEEDIKEQRHQICEKIREWCKENWDYDDFMYFLNKLEKGE